jgi:hypothetical protein
MLEAVLRFAPALLSTVLYELVGLIALTMGYKSISSRQFLPFHEEAAGKRWDDLGPGLQSVLRALLKLTGLGFLVVGLQLVSFPIVSLFVHDPVLQYGVAFTSFVYCFGLFLVNYQLKVKTGVETPWRGSLYATVAIVVAVTVSFVHL